MGGQEKRFREDRESGEDREDREGLNKNLLIVTIQYPASISS